jgi:hypothetical protein
MRNTIYAVREDGLGERLCAIFNGLVLEEIADVDFKFYWPSSKYLKRCITQSIGCVEEIFSEEFIQKYCLRSFDKDQYKYMRPIEGDVDKYVMEVKNQNKEGCCLVPQSNIFRKLRIERKKKSELFKKVSEKIKYTDNIALIKKSIEDKNISDNLTAIHIRAGDIIYGKYSIYPDFSGKVITLPLVLHIISSLEGKNIALFGQEEDMMKIITKNFGLIDVLEYYNGNEYSTLEKAMADIFFMSKCSKIFSGSSGFSRFASMIGMIENKNVFDILNLKDIGCIIDDEVLKNREILNDKQIAYSYLIAFHKSYGKSHFDILKGFIEKAISYDVDNMLYNFLYSVLLYINGLYVESEFQINIILRKLSHMTYEEFEKSDFKRMLKRSNTVEKYAPIIKPSKKNSPLNAETVYRFFNGDIDEEILYQKLIKKT